MCRAVFEIPTATATVVVVPAAAAVVEKGRGSRKVKDKQAAILPTASVSASSLPVNLFASSVLVTTTTHAASSDAKVNPNEINQV